MLDIIIEGGKLVYPDATIDADLAVNNGKIVAVGSSSSFGKAEQTIDASGKYVVPGGVDPHVHIYVPFMGTRSMDEWENGTMALAVGGTTTAIDFAGIGWKHPSLLGAVKARRQEADGKVVIDYGLHAVPSQHTTKAVDEVSEIVKSGVPDFKIFMVYRADKLAIEDGELVAIWRELARNDGMMLLHTENDAMAVYNVGRALKEGKRKPVNHYYTKSNLVEAEAINRALFISEQLNAAFYDVHMSVREGVALFREARKKGRPVYSETITHYLVLTKDTMERPDGYNFLCSPPLREKEDQEALWRGLAEGVVSVVGSDQAAYSSKSKKRASAESFDKIPNGFPGMEFRVPILFSEGVLKRRISVNRFVAVTSTNAAKIFGLYPKKGALFAGSDADIVVIDPKAEKTIRVGDSLYHSDWYPYAGMKVKGWPVVTLSKGVVLAKDGKFVGPKRHGKFLPRRLSKEALTRPIV